MKKIKLFLRNVKQGFATNSSSYHSMIMMTEEEKVKWENGEIEIDGYSYEEWNDNNYYEESHDSKEVNGVTVHVFAKYGYDG